METKYSGAFSRRRYSNYTTTVNGFTLTANPADPSMGNVQVFDFSLADKQDTGYNQTGNDRGSQVIGSGLTVAPGTVTGSYKTYKVQANPKPGYRFLRWDYAPYISNPAANPQIVTLSRNMTFTAYFGKVDIPYTLHVDWNTDMGRVTCNCNGFADGEISITPGTQVTLSARPKDGYKFVRWSGINLAGNTQSNTSSTITITMPNGPLNLSAIFTKEESGGGNEDPGETPNVITDTPNPPVGTGTVGGGNTYTNTVVVENDMFGAAMAFLKKWWWALLIVAYLLYDKKGGKL